LRAARDRETSRVQRRRGPVPRVRASEEARQGHRGERQAGGQLVRRPLGGAPGLGRRSGPSGGV